MIDPVTSFPLYMQIYGHLQSQILDGTLKVGDKLPSERELGGIYNASRITVRQALERLVKDDLIVTVQGKGAYVRRPLLKLDLMQVRSFGAIMQERGLAASTRLLAFEEIANDEVFEEIVKDDAFTGFAGGEASRMELMGYVQGKPAVHYRAIIRRDVAQRIVPVAREHERQGHVFSTFSLFNEIGCRISQVKQEIFAEEADDFLASVLDVLPGKALLKTNSLAFDAAKAPLEYKVAHYRSDRYSFSLVRENVA